MTSWTQTLRALQQSVGGKLVAKRLYVHASAVARFPPPLRASLDRARRAGGVGRWSVLKLGARADGTRVVSFLDYPTFWTEPNPALAQAWTVSLDPDGPPPTITRYARPIWILHRKEEFLAHNDPRREAFAAETREFERRGLFAPALRHRIGHRDVWERLLREAKPNRGPKPNPAVEPSRCYSERTSLRQVPALLTALVRTGGLRAGMTNADIGGGRYNEGTAFLAAHGVTNVVYDCQLQRAHNDVALRRVEDGRAHAATVANVLNVIPDPRVRREVVALAANVVRPGGAVWIAVYEGDGDGKSRTTPRGWQEHRPLATYLDEVRSVLPTAALVTVGRVRAIRAIR